ncbi:hypothetical protein M011DRAFT_483102 [Sporormia fimetaria CBS 119925]|uniref:RING-type domain-containing protein n=1 Tax=Sporormia fimetaria CBS 119925 TaxID=1340428 RepID=A0A6A6VNK0_9PLEO|nr:hypothetical protein M011DRAFT_483102 [Sporormia fimetaria CBS 119925]
MGTLTADCPRLDSHCPHKLATSCRLTSTPNCCACADERPHSLTYRVYIDGVGFVQRGTRWQSYCWFCKEFWTNRLAATDPPLETSQTRIPEVPDQTEFLARWFEFHQGYRIVKNADGEEQRIAVLGEELKEVSPGFLPRTLDEMRRRVSNTAQRPANRFRRRRLTSEDARPNEPLQSIEDALDELLELSSDDEPDTEVDTSPTTGPAHSDSQHTENQSGEQVVSAADREFAANVGQIIAGATRIFGTREEIDRDDYVSPITTMYSRAYNAYYARNNAQSRPEVTEPIRPDAEPPVEGQTTTMNIAELDGTSDSGANTPTDPPPTTRAPPTFFPPRPPTTYIASSSASEDALASAAEIRMSLEQLSEELMLIREATEAVTGAQYAEALRLGLVPCQELNMDKQDRPPPLDDDDMTRKLACSVCYCQLADVALLPCGHMVLCEWCADTMIPVKHSHVPMRPSKCPVCRKIVKQRFRIRM